MIKNSLKRRLQVIGIISRNQSLNQSELIDLLRYEIGYELSQPNISQVLSFMCKDGVLIKYRSRGSTMYKITDEAKDILNNINTGDEMKKYNPENVVLVVNGKPCGGFEGHYIEEKEGAKND